MKADVSQGPVDCESYSVNQMIDISSENNLGTFYRKCFINITILNSKIYRLNNIAYLNVYRQT